MGQPEHGEHGATDRRDLLSLNGSDHRLWNLDHVADGGDRQDDFMARHSHPNPLGDQHAGGKFDVKAGSFSNFALNTYSSVQCFDAVAHNIHADSAAGQVGDFIDSRETGCEDDLEGCLLVHHRDRCLGKQPFLDHTALELFGVQSFAIVLDFDYDVGASSIGGEIDAADGGLAVPHAVGFGFDSMARGVADDMSERIADGIDDRLIQFRVFATYMKLDVLVEAARNVTHQAREALKHLTHRHHSDGHHRRLQIVRQAGD